MSETKSKLMDFSEALLLMKEGATVSRIAFGREIEVAIQFPDDNSKMTLPYIYMRKRGDCFPVDFSPESIFAEDWYLVR